MTGLRIRNREDRQRRILESAARHLRESRYDDVGIEMIAESAGVSVGTIYNYYKNKGDILVAIVSMEVHEVLASGAKIVAAPPNNAEKAINALVLGYVDHSLTYLNKAMWRQAMAISIIQPTSPSGAAYGQLDVALEQQTVTLLTKLGTMGLVRKDVDAENIGKMIFHSMDNRFINFVKDDGVSLAQLKSSLRKSHQALVSLIAA